MIAGADTYHIGNYYVTMTILIHGMRPEQFTVLDKAHFRTLVAMHAGSVCGMGCDPCTKGDISELIIQDHDDRRHEVGVLVTFSLEVADAIRASVAATSVQTYITSPSFVTDGQLQGGVVVSSS